MIKRDIRKIPMTDRKLEAPRINSSDQVVLELWVRAGGRCEFYGCNTDLLMDELTTNEAKIANIAHIVARKLNGPRGNDPLPLDMRNKIDNLMLTCPKCHILIDNKRLVRQYPKELLQKYKMEHESRIKYLTSLGPINSTVVLRVLGNIRGDSVSISKDEIRMAVLESTSRYPRYMSGENHIEIDMTGLPKRFDDHYWKFGISKIDEVIDRLIQPAIESKLITHLSVFALARIPFLVHLGFRLGDKVPTTLYQKHRDDKEGWSWKNETEPVQFQMRLIHSGCVFSKIALILSISGGISKQDIPSKILNEYYVYEIIPEGINPGRDLLESVTTIGLFRKAFHDFLRFVENKYKKVDVIHIFPAIPPAIAITCGRELLKDVSPGLLIYDKYKNHYYPVIRVN